uniref:Sodium-coupled monocarboxylate transporter 2 n=1 Tax=Glossina pallidipes TaxID=7398 RepID=A0A1A9ZG68_GLOPL
MSIICIFFSIKGGLKAAINADVIQTVTVILVSLAVIIKGTIFSGGVKRVYEINRNDGRFSFFTFTGDLTVRVDTTSAWLGQLFMSLSQFGCQQNFMQRYVSLKSTTEVKRAMLSNIPVIFVFFSLSWLCGLVIYASYAKCDPLAEGYIQKPDEILPFYVEDQLAFIPGFLGIFMATLFNGALCMMVSNLNSLATVVWEDFLSFLPQLKGLSDKQQLVVIKTVTAVFGLIVMGVAFSVGLLSGVTESSMLTFSATSGPLLGCFILAMLIPIANWKGTSIGMISSCAIVVWMTAGGLTIDKSARTQLLPTSTEGCSNFTFSQSIHKPSTNEFSIVPKLTSWEDPSSSKFAKIANDTLLLSSSVAALIPTAATAESLIGTALTVIIGIIGSYLTQDPKDMYDAKLLHPIVFKLYQHFPGKKPYYVKDVEYTCDSVGSGANTTRGSGGGTSNGGIENASNGIGIAAKINHAFEPQNEGNIIIAASATDAANNATVTTIDGDDKKKEKNPMDKRSDQNDEDSLSDSIGDYTKQTPTDQLEDFCGFTDTEETDEGTTDKNACSTSSKSNETPNAHGNPNEQTSPAALRVNENTRTSTGNRLPITPTVTTATNAIMPLAPRHRRIRQPFSRQNNQASITLIFHFYYI